MISSIYHHSVTPIAHARTFRNSVTCIHAGPEFHRAAVEVLDRNGCDLSFSGLKTAVRRARDLLAVGQGGLTRADRADLCAGFQAAPA